MRSLDCCNGLDIIAAMLSRKDHLNRFLTEFLDSEKIFPCDRFERPLQFMIGQSWKGVMLIVPDVEMMCGWIGGVDQEKCLFHLKKIKNCIHLVISDEKTKIICDHLWVEADDVSLGEHAESVVWVEQVQQHVGQELLQGGHRCAAAAQLRFRCQGQYLLSKGYCCDDHNWWGKHLKKLLLEFSTKLLHSWPGGDSHDDGHAGKHLDNWKLCMEQVQGQEEFVGCFCVSQPPFDFIILYDFIILCVSANCLAKRL